jgi:hypothetical protein
MVGPNGGWAQTHGTPATSAFQLFVSIDEDQVADSERQHISEVVGYAVFGSSVGP